MGVRTFTTTCFNKLLEVDTGELKLDLKPPLIHMKLPAGPRHGWRFTGSLTSYSNASESGLRHVFLFFVSPRLDK